MASLADLNFQQGVSDESVKQVAQQHYQAAAADASQKYLNGDVQGAISSLMKADPQLATQVLHGAAGQYNPELQGQIKGAEKTGELGAEQKFAQLPTQVAEARGKRIRGSEFKDINLEAPDGSVVKAFVSKTDHKVYDLSGNEMSANDLAGYKAGFAPVVRTNANTKNPETVSKGGKINELNEPSPMIESTDTGAAVALKPKQNLDIQAAVKDWNNDKQNKDLVSQINSLDVAKNSTIANPAGGGAFEKLRLLRGVTPRPAVQEFMQVNVGQGWQTELESYLSQAEGNSLGPREQKNLLHIIDIYQQANLNDYNQALHSRVAQIAANTHVDPSIVLKRLAPELPTPIQNAMQKVGDLPKEEQQVIDMAHKYLLTHKRGDPDYQDALKVLRLHGL